MNYLPRSVKMRSLLGTIAASIAVAAVVVAMIGRSPAAPVPWPRARPPAADAYVPTTVRTIPIVAATPAVVRRHEPSAAPSHPEFDGDPDGVWPRLERPAHRARARVVKLTTIDRTDRTDRSDICARHKLRKVMTNDGKSWRCRR